MQKYARIEVGETAPVFRQKSTSNEDFNFDTAAGRYILLGLFGSSSVDGGMLDFVTRNRDLFDDRKLSFFGVTIDVEDERQERLRASLPGIRYFWDFDGKVSRQYGAAPLGVVDGAVAYKRRWVLLDPDLRIRAVVPVREDGGEGPQLARLLADLPALDAYSGLQVQAPVLVLANVFEPELCARLVAVIGPRSR